MELENSLEFIILHKEAHIYTYISLKCQHKREILIIVASLEYLIKNKMVKILS